MLVASASFLNDFPVHHIRRDKLETDELLLRWGVYTSIRAIYGAAAGFAALGAGGFFTDGTTRLIVATVTAALVAEPLDVAFNGLPSGFGRAAPGFR